MLPAHLQGENSGFKFSLSSDKQIRQIGNSNLTYSFSFMAVFLQFSSLLLNSLFRVPFNYFYSHSLFLDHALSSSVFANSILIS